MAHITVMKGGMVRTQLKTMCCQTALSTNGNMTTSVKLVIKAIRKKKTNLGWSVITSIRISFFSLFLEVDATVCHVFCATSVLKLGFNSKLRFLKNKIFSHLNFSGHPIWATCRQQISTLVSKRFHHC